jgi:hypothetical protein
MDYKYERIDEDRRERLWLWKTQFLGAVLLGAAAIAALSSVATVGVMKSLQAQVSRQLCDKDPLVEPPKQYSCGESFDEAHQRGCTFDALTLTWLHPKCSQYGQKEYLEVSKTSINGSWQFWDDKSGTHELGGYEALTYLPEGESYWTTQQEHLHHCMWMLMRVHDAATTPGKRLDTKSGSFEHTKHCLEMLVEQATIGAGENISHINVKGRSMDIGWAAC